MKKITKTLWLICIAVLISIGAKAQTYYGAGQDVYTYSNQPVILYGSSATTYKWFLSKGLSNDTIAQPTVTIDTTTTYILKYTIPSDTTHYYDTLVAYVVTPPSPNSVASCTNLVNNGDMESGSCANQYSNIPSTWYAPPNSAGTPDYFNYCMGASAPCGIGYESAGSQTPAGGNGMAGIIIQANSNGYLEYLEQHLPCALAVGQTYSVSFQASWGSNSAYSCGNIGALLTTTQVTGVPAQYYIAGTPQVSGSCNTSTSWQTFSGTLAGNNEQYITIGHFGVNGVCTPTVSFGNDYNYIDNVTIAPIKPTVTTSTTSICQGQFLTLTETGSPASACTWYDPSGTVLGTGSPLLAAATVSGTYSVSVNLCSSCTALTNTVYISVTPNTSITVTGPSSACLGSPFTYTASQAGASSYTWNPSGATGSNHTFTVFTSGVQTYTVISNTCGKTVFTVNINPLPVITIAPSAPVTCPGTPIILTASGANTYTWSTSATTASISVSPTVATVYTVTATSSVSCVNTKTITVTMQTNTCTGTQPSYTISSSGTPFNPANGFIGQTMYINSPASYTINCANLTIAPTASIVVGSGATLTIKSSWLHVCTVCGSNMWKGILVKNGGTINVNNYSIIEDADTAIRIQAQPTGTVTSTWAINSSTFNKNGTGFYVGINPANFSTSKIYNTIFTCRNLSSHSVTSATFTATKSSIAAATPLVPGTNTPTVTMAGTRTANHMYLNQATNGYGIYIGDTTQSNNIFDNADNGVVSGLTPVIIKNNTFQNFTGSDCQCYGSPNPIGVGVYVSGASLESGPAPKIIIGNNNSTIIASSKNYFTNCLRGVNIYDCQNVYINNNTFNNETTATTFTVAGGSATGEYAVINTGFAIYSSSTTTTEQSQFANNTVNNYATGYWLDCGKLYNTGYQPVSFYNNTISAAGTNTLYCNTGIYIQQSNTYGAGSGVTTDAISVSTNSITNVNINAISISAVNTATATTGFVNVLANTELSVKYNSAATSTVSPHIAAVYVSGSNRININNNTKIQCTGLTSYTNTNAQYIAGIYISTSPSSTINCNTVNYVGEAYVWEGASPTSKWVRNQARHSRYGLVLRNSGVMGDQGSPGTPYGDIFGKYVSGGTDITDAHTLADNSNPGLTGFTSKLYNLASTCSGITTYLPCQNNYNSGTAYATGVTTFSTTGSFPCGICSGDCFSGRMAANAADSAAIARDSILNDMVYNIENGNPFPIYDLQTRWALQYYVNSQNDSIKAANGYENARNFAIIDGALSENNYSKAQSLLSVINPNNMVEDNWLSVDNITIKMQNDTLDNTDVSTLKAVAIQCPLTGGNIVYNARAILNRYNKNITEYKDNCNDNGNNNRLTSINQTIEKSSAVSVYPNPNKGSMTFTYHIKTDAHLEISDLNGRLVGTYILPATNNQFEVRNEYLKDGVYFYRVVDSKNTVIKTGKIVVMQ